MLAKIGPQNEVSDLVRKAQEGDQSSFALLYERFFDQIFRYVSFKTGSPTEAEDITGEVFVRMIESIHRFKWQGHPFSSWLFRIAHNLIVDYFRKKGKKALVPLEGSADNLRSAHVDVDRRIDLEIAMDEIRRAMEGLTDLQREVISMRFAGGLSVAETARAIGKKDNAIKALQHAGLKKLRMTLAAENSLPVLLHQLEG
ncbi:MAG: sigma-70 family RNA polymerase sigma factor [Chloroflexi bacterium]|nr:sigma-70 family RNA polymerase sigma factor [Chloroflexota bacterium]